MCEAVSRSVRAVVRVAAEGINFISSALFSFSKAFYESPDGGTAEDDLRSTPVVTLR